MIPRTDSSEWPAGFHHQEAGPWREEPDRRVWTHDTTGLPCLILRNRYGALCGYVGVPAEHPWHGLDYRDREVDELHKAAHGGLTYSAPCADGDPEHGICHHDPDDDRPVWWFGFDCAHAWDYQPGQAPMLRSHGIDPLEPFGDEVYRSIRYVEARVGDMATTLAAAPVTFASIDEVAPFVELEPSQ